MKRHLTGYLLFALLSSASLLSCDKEDKEGTLISGTGNMNMTVRLSKESAAAAPEDDTAMKSLKVWIVRRDDGLILRYRRLAADVNDDELSFSEDGKTASLRLADIPRGNCTIYAVANHEGPDADRYAEGESIDGDFQDLLLGEVSPGEEPAFESGHIPCSAVSDFAIGAGENNIEIHLLRCVGRISIAVRNNIDGSSMFFKSVGLSDNNPSTAYLFRHDGKIPETADNVAFKDLTSIQRVEAKTNEPVVIYDRYLYETDPDAEDGNFSFDIFGAVYRNTAKDSDAEIDYRQEYSFEINNAIADASLSDFFLIRSAASENIYIGDKNGLAYKLFSGDTEMKHHRDIENYFWKFSGNSRSTLTNAVTGRQLKLDGETAAMAEDGGGTNFSLEIQSGLNGLRFNSGSYRLTIDPDRGLFGTTGNYTDETLWYIRKVNKVQDAAIPYFRNAEYEIPRTRRALTYIDEYGVTRKLRRIGRNEHLRVIIGIFYNRETGQFNFSVEPWRKKESETTFD